MAGQGPDYNDFEMITSPKVLLPARSDGTLVSSGPQFRGSGDASLPEHVGGGGGRPSSSLPERVAWKLEDNPSQATYNHSIPAPQSSEDRLEWEVPAKGVDDVERNSQKKKKKKKRRCAGCCGFCGLPRKWKWTIGVVTTLVFLGVLAGGIAGGLMSRTYYNSSSYYDSDDFDTSRNPAEAARLAALNWTDGANETRHAVFYQMQGALFLQQYYEANKSWVSHNISADFWPQNLNIPSVKVGTPLAAAATPATRGADTAFSAVLYYLNSDNEIRELVSSDEDNLGQWSYGEGHPSRSAANWTQLAAAPDFCDSTDGCRNAFCYAYQNRDQNVMFACGDDWSQPTQLDGAHPGGAVALVPFVYEQNGGSDNATLVSEMQLFHYTDTTVKMFHIWSNSSWDAEEKPIISTLDTEVNPYTTYGTAYDNETPRVVATPANGDADVFALGVTGSYTLDLKGSWYVDGAWERDQSVEMVGRSRNLSSSSSSSSEDMGGVALDHAGYFYAASYDEYTIYQYGWSADDPFTLTYVGDVNIWEDCIGDEYDGCV